MSTSSNLSTQDTLAAAAPEKKERKKNRRSPTKLVSDGKTEFHASVSMLINDSRIQRNVSAAKTALSPVVIHFVVHSIFTPKNFS